MSFKTDPMRSSINVQSSYSKKALFKEDESKLTTKELKKIQDKKLLSVFSEDTLEIDYDSISATYEQQYVEAGFPPMICASLVSQLCPENRVKKQILDIGCGKGFVGQYLKEQGFMNIQGIDCSKNFLLQA